MKTTLIILATAAGFAATPSMAQDRAPFSGAHVGVEAGWGRVGGSRVDGDGLVYGSTIGYDFALGDIRVGPEAEITGSTQKTCIDRQIGAVRQRDCQRTDRDLYIGGRVGYVLDPRLMLYAKGGYTNARFTDRIENVGTPDRFDLGANHDGYRVGAGVEYALTSRFYVSGEYRYSHYTHDDVPGQPGHGANMNQIVSGVSFRF